MKKAPSPTERKPQEPPPPTKIPTHKTFTYEPEKKEPTLDDTHPRLANLLHIVMMSLLFGAAFFLGASYILFRSRGSHGLSIIIAALAGGLFFIYRFYRLTKF